MPEYMLMSHPHWVGVGRDTRVHHQCPHVLERVEEHAHHVEFDVE